MAKKRQYKSIDDLNAAQKKFSKQCREIEQNALSTLTNPTGILMDIGIGFISNRIFGNQSKNKEGKIANMLPALFGNKKNSSQKQGKGLLSGAKNTPSNNIFKKLLRGSAKIFIKYQLLNMGLWLGEKAIDVVKKKRAAKKLAKAEAKLHNLLHELKPAKQIKTL